MGKYMVKVLACLFVLGIWIGLCTGRDTAMAASTQNTKITDISFARAQKKTLILYKGQSYSLGTTVTPKNKKVNYTLSKKKIISVHDKGKIKALNIGQVTLTAKLKNNSQIKSKLKIKVVSKKKFKKIQNITPQKKIQNLNVGECRKIAVSIKPANASNQNLQYTSSDTACVHVNPQGKIFALNEGTAKVTIRALDGSKKKTQVNITVTAKPESDTEYLYLDIHQKDAVMTEVQPSLTGTYRTNGNLKSVSYTLHDFSSAKEDAKTRNLAVIGNGSWKIPKVNLSPGKNSITVTAETYGGIRAEKSIVLTYDRGGLDAQPQIENIEGVRVSEDGKLQIKENFTQKGMEEGECCAPYVNNRLLLYLAEDITDARKAEILADIKAEEIASLHTIQLSQVELSHPFESLMEIENYIEALCIKYPEILAAEPEWVLIEPEEVIYNDPWNQAEWDIKHPAGENWWAEAVHAPLAWDYAKKMQPLRIGILDNGFDTRTSMHS